MYEKYTAIPFGIGAYSDAGPVSGNVPPMLMIVLVTPGVAASVRVCANTPETPMADAAVAVSASATSAFLMMTLPSLSRAHRRAHRLRADLDRAERSSAVPAPEASPSAPREPET
jgi:hypothetical protein